MIVSLNFIISLVAFWLAYRAYQHGHSFLTFSLFLVFVGCASLSGGFYHLMAQNPATTQSVIAGINHYLPQAIQISLSQLKIRLWYVTVVLIGFSECLFFFLLSPVFCGKLKYIEYYFLFMLGVFMLANLLVDHYIVVVSFHVLTQGIFILLSLYLYLKYRQTRILWLPLLALYNIISGVMQQLMMRGYVPTGHLLHYNDWYHLSIIGFLFLAYFVMVSQGVTKLLEAIQGNIQLT